MPIRITGMQSGLDTDSIIKDLVEVKQGTVDKEIKAQKQAQVVSDVWKELNGEIYDLFTGLIDELRYTSAYSKKSSSSSNDSIVNVIASGNAVNSTQQLEVMKMAKAGYLTGGKLEGKNTASTKLSELGIATGSSVSVTVGDRSIQVNVDENTTIDSFVKSLNAAGVSASFDETNQRFFISAKDTGAENDFTIIGSNADGKNMLDKLGLSYYDSSMEDALNNIINNKDSNIAERIALVEKTLNEQLTSYDKQIETKLDTFNNKYGDLFDGMDLAADDVNMDEVFDRIDEVIADPEAAGLKEDDAKLKELTKFKEETTKILDNKQDTLGKLDVDAEGNYVLNQAEKDVITAAAEAEVAEAENTLANLDSLKDTGKASKINGSDALIKLNGVEFESQSNNVSVNGLTFELKSTTAAGETVTVTTGDDTSAVYDKICDFFKEYNTLINKMDKLYNAASGKDYQPLTDAEKEDLSDKEIEEWEKKIKDSALSGDSTLSSVSGAMKSIMSAGITIGGQTMYLADFGIETQGYFTAKDNEKNAYHIAGADGFLSSSKDDVLKSTIASDPDKVTEFFSKLSDNLYNTLFDSMKSSQYSSSYTVYDDKKMKTEISDYEASIKKLQDKLQAYEDYWYDKFSAMEVALAKMQSNSSAISGLFTA